MCVAMKQPRCRLRHQGRTLLWLCLTSTFIVAIVLLAPYVLHAIHPGPTGGGG